jgi:phosphoesterase RecJ-like protein
MSDRAPAESTAEGRWDDAVRCLATASSVALVCHVSPDGDALGSMLGLGLALSARGTAVACSWSAEEFELPEQYGFLPGQRLLVPPADFPAEPEVLVVLDTASRDRLGELAGRLDTAGHVLALDHHAHNSGVPGTVLVDDRAAATAVLVDELLRRMRAPVTAEIAVCLYTALATDTGSFKYDSTTPAVHELAARLLATGISPDPIARSIWDTKPLGYLQLLGAALSRVQFEPAAAGGRGLVWTHTTAAELAEFALRPEETDGIVDVVRTAAEADVAAVFKEHPGGYTVSTRSRGAVDVGAACASLGGGGHRLAAGFSSTGPLPAAVAALRRALDGAGSP